MVGIVDEQADLPLDLLSESLPILIGEVCK